MSRKYRTLREDFYLLVAFTIFCIVLTIGTFAWLINRLSNSEDFYFYGSMPRTSYKSIPMFECAWCHTNKKLNRHHIVPQSANPALRDDYTNIVILCRSCHEVLGHRRNWKKFNPDVLEIVSTYTNCVWSKDYFDNISKSK